MQSGAPLAFVHPMAASRLLPLGVALLLALGACDRHDDDDGDASPLGDARGEVTGDGDDPSWREVAQVDTGGPAIPDSLAIGESWQDISAAAVNDSATRLPLGKGISGPSVLRVQVLLDRALFSPGAMDGRWGLNTEKAVYWLQKREGLRATATVDSLTFARLATLAGEPDALVRRHALTEADVAGPFVDLPEDYWEQAELDCTCYESRSEKLAETFHTTPRLLAKLNPGVSLDRVEAGTAIWVPAIRDTAARGGAIARIAVSDRGRYLHALDAAGRILMHFPATLGASYEPSPTGDYRVVRIKENPAWHLQPAILEQVPDDKPEAIVPAGPNNAVGMVWMALSAPHYGIHGTKAPETIGYASSAGCVRLTNWDAVYLARRIGAGTAVGFRDPKHGQGRATASR